MVIQRFFRHSSGFTLVELIVGIAVLGILTIVALPSLNTFVIGLRVDEEVSEIHRLVLSTRNTAINSGNGAIMCPIASGECGNDWTQDISIFEDVDSNGDFSVGDNLIKVKSAINSADTLTFSGGNLLRFSPRGTLTNNTNDATFSYCPAGYSDKNRGVVISPLGRPYITTDSNSDGKDEDRNGSNITC